MKLRGKWVFVAAAVVATGAVPCAIWMDIRHGQDPAEAKARRLVAELCRRFKDEPASLWGRMLSELGVTCALDDLNLDEIRSKPGVQSTDSTSGHTIAIS